MLNGLEVDIKNTVGRNWTIPKEARGHPCIVVQEDEAKALCSFGLIIAKPERLNPSKNRDGKSTFSKAGLIHVHWLLRNSPYPKNFWLDLPEDTRTRIVESYSDTQRLVTLFREVQRKPISRQAVQAIAPQLDPMKRLRQNGGARDHLTRQGIALLTGRAHGKLIQELGLPRCKKDEVISFCPTDESVVSRLRKLDLL